MWKNTREQYGLISRLLHWLSAIVIMGLFILGYWMVDLDYYHQWYQKAPHIHQSIGVLLLIATLLRLIWRFTDTKIAAIDSHSSLVKLSSSLTHLALYILLFIIMISGYLISTSDGRAIEVFNWFILPAMGELFANQEDISGLIHEYAAYILIGMALLHAAAAIKHHLIDKDKTLKRMLK